MDTSLKVMRKLGDDECLYDNEFLNKNFLLCRALRTSVPKPFEIDHDILTKALSIWIKRHPFLQAYIHRTNDPAWTKSKILMPKYFVYLDKNFSDYNNIEIIETNNELLWTEVIETELKTLFSLENEPLWRMKIIKLLCNDANSNHYDFIFTNHHAIGDGRNLYTIMIQFLNILGALLENKTCDEMNGEIEHSNFCMEELVHDFKSKPEYKSSKVDTVFDPNTNRTPSTIGNPNGVHGRFLHIYTENSKLKKLITKMKANAPECKLTSLLVAIFCMAFRKSYIKHGVGEVPLDSFQFDLLSSIREKLKLKNSQMGVYSVALMCRIDQELNNESIWGIAEKLSTELHKRINANEDIEGISHMDELLELIESDIYETKQPSNFAFSNIGVMRNTENSVIKLKEHYVGMPTVEKRFAPGIFNGVTTIDNNMCWAISFNEKIFSVEFFKSVRNEIVSIVDQLILD